MFGIFVQKTILKVKNVEFNICLVNIHKLPPRPNFTLFEGNSIEFIKIQKLEIMLFFNKNED
jgi:hypothetical protein